MFTLLSLVGFFFTLAATFFVRRFAVFKGILDKPTDKPQQIHQEPVPLLGGLALFAGLAVTLALAFGLKVLPGDTILSKHVVGILLGGLWLVIGGYLDDKHTFSPKQQIIWPMLAAVTVIISGVGIESITNPFGGQWFLDQRDFVLFWLGGLPYKVTLVADLFTFVWLMSMIYALKLFDGLDGLVSGITIIGSLVIYVTSLLPQVYQPDTGLLALIVASCFAGFLVLNFHPARIFLGESGSTLAGFLVGSLAILSEGKVVTTLVVMALPILDLLWVVLRRVVFEKQSLAQADRKHIHHRLLEMGVSHRRAVLLLYGWALALALLAFLFQGRNQWIALGLVVLAFLAFVLYLGLRVSKRV